ncbi:MAG: hypothetical protein GC191_15245 [Azospirillum sp.]|nr:hypothetical protein [Azospirillum sp.]
MDWYSALAVFAIAAAITITVVVLLAVRSLRRSLDDGPLKQANQMRRLIETVATLSQQQQDADAKILRLAEAHRKLAEDLAAMGERLGEGGTAAANASRVIH